MSGTVIRKARKEDVPQMLKLIKELADFEKGLHLVTVTESDLLRDGFGKNPLFHALIAEKNLEIHGMAVYFYTYSTWNGKTLYLEDLIVSESSRSKGIGKQLMDEIIKIAKEQDVHRISWQVLNWNVEAQKFYKRFEASLDDEWLNGRLDSDQIRRYKNK
ncbi:MAG TPA: GNAT family N-acetyltransferase [Flavobacteriales bacterium]|nr:GNAT family N-acetyltransferase [Flavobacteriales bacterium]